MALPVPSTPICGAVAASGELKAERILVGVVQLLTVLIFGLVDDWMLVVFELLLKSSHTATAKLFVFALTWGALTVSGGRTLTILEGVFQLPPL